MNTQEYWDEIDARQRADIRQIIDLGLRVELLLQMGNIPSGCAAAQDIAGDWLSENQYEQLPLSGCDRGLECNCVWVKRASEPDAVVKTEQEIDAELEATLAKLPAAEARAATDLLNRALKGFGLPEWRPKAPGR